jgi:GNAT superfamily N-acetyltransferase
VDRAAGVDEAGPDRWRIGVSVDHRYRGRGLGAALIRAGVKRLRGDPAVAAAAGGVELLGEVKVDNGASARAFEIAGFARPAGTGRVRGHPAWVYRLAWPAPDGDRDRLPAAGARGFSR